MNQVTIIGNLTADPQQRTTQQGKMVTSFTVAVNRRQSAQAGQQEADFFRVSAWNQLGETCARYLAKGRKVCVIGSVRAGCYTNSQNQAVGTLEVLAHEVEFLSPKDQQPTGQQRQEAQYAQEQQQRDAMNAGYVVVEDENLPF